MLRTDFDIFMGSSLPPVIANMVMKDLEKQALSTFYNPPHYMSAMSMMSMLL